MNADGAADDLADQLLTETREELVRADNKAGLILAGASVVAAVILGGAAAGDIAVDDQASIVIVLAVLAAIAIILGIVFTALAVFPRTGTTQAGRARYFADITAYRTDDEVAAAIAAEAQDRGRRTRQQLRVLAGTVATKYAWIQRAMIALGFGFTLAGFAAILSLLLP